MAKDYRRNKPMRRGGSRQFLQIMLAFVTGYLLASIFDFASLTHWVKTSIIAREEPAKNTTMAETGQARDLPKPKFEFYTLLANGRTSTTARQEPIKTQTLANLKSPSTVQTQADIQHPQPAPVTSPPVQEKTKTIVANSASWLIQVGSFKTLPEAEKMKAALILKGYSVRVMSVNQAQVNWFRVLIGPYGSQSEAQQVQLAFSKLERVQGMIRKV